MSKELEALERLYCAGRLDLPYVQSNKHKEDYSIIEKGLKTLEIIKNKQVNVLWLTTTLNVTEYNFGVNWSQHLTKEQYDFLREVLKNV